VHAHGLGHRFDSPSSFVKTKAIEALLSTRSGALLALF
jgi:hypothetical protein